MIEKIKIAERRKEIAEIRHADSVFRDIEGREKDREEFEQRWFWELLQNAKDSIECSEKVNVIVEINDNELSFAHTGNPFELDDILSLIIQGSSKTNKDGKTGRFGTGFMTTYLLSKEVIISGKLSNNEGCFEFLLNRNGETNEEFYQRQLESNSAFDNSIREESYLGDSPFQTKFVYKLNSKGKQTAEIGLKSIDELIPFTQLFNDQIASVSLVNNTEFRKSINQHCTYKKKFVNSISFNDEIIDEWSLETIADDIIVKNVTAYLLHNQSYEVCLITTKEDNIESILPLENNSPRLYYTFPLIGTEEIGIPYVINSTNFDPRIERDGVYLKINDAEIHDDNEKKNENEKQLINRKILEEALANASKCFAHIVSSKKIKGVYEIFNYKTAKEYKWLDGIWFNNLKVEVIDLLASIPLVEVNEIDERLPLANIKVSICEPGLNDINERLWSLINSFNIFQIPKLEENQYWNDIIKNRNAFKSDSSLYANTLFDLNDLIILIEDKVFLSAFVEILKSPAANWLDEFYSLIVDSEEYKHTFPLDKKILLNQNDEFRCGENMHWDHCNEKELISISALLNLNYANTFISNLITQLQITGISITTKQDATSKIKNHLNTLSETYYLNENHQEANARFLKWLIGVRNIDTIKDLKILSGSNKKDGEKIIVETFPKGKHLMLTPNVFFENSFPYFANIIRERDCMHFIYNNFLIDQDYKYLDENLLIHFSPLIKRTEKVDAKTIEYLIVNSDDLKYLRDGEGKIKSNIELTYSDFAYLTNSEGHIYERNSTSKSSLERFKFLLLEACEKDELIQDDLIKIKIEEGQKEIEFHQLLWIYRARKLQWINIKSDEEGKYFTETPSSANLSELINGDVSLVQSIRGKKQQAFLSKLGIGVSDLIRNTLPTDELRNSWDRAITNMLTSDADPDLAQEIFSDPNIVKEYENRLKQRKLIHRNQKIGALIEQLFVEIIANLKQEGLLINIERKPFGSDYLVTDESSDLINDNYIREGFKINNWLIELKATGKNYAAMTPLQAQTASDNKDNYALIVVPLDGTDPDLEYVRKNARVISNIGGKIGNIIGDYKDIESKKESLAEGKNGISVYVEEQNVRFNIESDVWTLEILSILDFMKETFSTKTAN